MFEAIINQLKQQAVDALTSQHNLTPTEAERTAEAAGKSLSELVKQQINQNDFSAVDEALSGSTTDITNPSIQKLLAPLSSKLAERTGMDSIQAHSIASTLLPLAFNMFNEQVAQAQTQGVDVKALVKQLATGGLNMANMSAAMTLVKQFSKGKAGIGGMFSKFF